MGVLVDIKGVSTMSLKRSCWAGFGLIFLWTFGIMLGAGFLNAMNQIPVISIYIMHVFLEWHSVVAWTAWFLCMAWGAIALSLPVRPRAPKRAALVFWMILMGLHIVTHAIWITVFCMRCHTFFLNSLAGNIAKSSIETFFEKSSKKAYVQDFLFVVTPVANWLSAPYIFRFLQHLHPLDIIFWSGWNWMLIAFFFGVLPILSVVVVIPLVMGYISAIDMGGSGTELVAPSKLELFYSLDVEDRAAIRAGQRKIEEFLLVDDEEQPPPHNSGTGSSNSPKQISRIPSYKPKRKTKFV